MYVRSVAMRLRVGKILLRLEFGWRREEPLVKNMSGTSWRLELSLTDS